MQSGPSVFVALTRIAKQGDTICLSLSGPSGGVLERDGVLLEIHPDGIVVESALGIEWIPATDIRSWRKPAAQVSAESVRDRSSSDVPVLDRTPGNRPLATNDTGNLTSNHTSAALPDPADLRLLFSGDPVINLPEPSFNFPSLTKDQQQIINRWKNKYDYAMKVREPARLTQEVTHIEELAEALSMPSLYFLAGLLAEFSGLGNLRAKTCFIKALELDQNHQEASIAVAALAIRDKDWLAATNFLFWSTRIEGKANKTSLIRCLGQCILRLNEREDIPPIGAILSQSLPEEAKRMLINLIALLVEEDKTSYKLILSGEFEQFRRINSFLFPSDGAVKPPFQTRNMPSSRNSVSASSLIRRGRVSVYYPDRGFGFIVEDGTKQSWIFYETSVSHSSFLETLEKERPEVTFRGDIKVLQGRYPLAFDVSGSSTSFGVSTEKIKRAPLYQRLQSIPKDGSSFAKAMVAEQLDRLDEAEILYLDEITKQGKHRKSAVKNLANLKNRRKNPEAAIKVLEEYRSLFEESEYDSLNHMQAQFLVKLRKYGEAARILSELASRATNLNKKIDYLRQEAYCFLAMGDFDKSIQKLQNILKSYPNDSASQLLLAKAEEAKQTGIVPSETTTSSDEDMTDDLLSSLSLGLSALARRHLDNCELRGIDTRTKESRSFRRQDVEQVQELLEGLKGRRPRERADYLLTLAWLCEHASNVTGNKSVHVYLRRHFLAVAEAAMSEDAPKDAVRCYALESLMLCPVVFEEKSDARNSFEAAWVLLLGTYLPFQIEPSKLLEPQAGRRLPNILDILRNHPDQWKKFVNDLGFYKIKAPTASDHLVSFLKNDPVLKIRDIDISEEKATLREIERIFRSTPTDTLSSDRIRYLRDSVSQIIPKIRFELDKKRTLDILRITEELTEYSLERGFKEKENRFLRVDLEIGQIIDDINLYPTHLSFEYFTPCLSVLRNLLREDFSRSELIKPSLNLQNLLENDYYLLVDGCVSLRLLLDSKDEIAPPIEAISLIAEGSESYPCHLPEPLHGGQSREFELIVKPSDKQIADGVFTVGVVVEYRTRKGVIERSQPFLLPVRLGEPSFSEIPNPYGRYSGGSPVEDEEMFFGRASLIERIVKLLSTGDMGQCFVLYGQKRSGKSSVLKQVERRIEPNTIFASLSAGTFTPGNLWVSFARLLIQELSFQAEDRNIDLPINWPQRHEIEESPIEVVRKVLRAFSKLGYRVVIAIDEFTYIYESSFEDAETFMRGWKALLESRLFNALLIGQDTMPRFKQTFPNEFGVTHDERITYLEEKEANDLASKPILLNGSSRYRGQALRRLFELTAGSPFFLQIMCDRLVRHLNDRKAAFITEADIEQVVKTLTLGNDALPPERFDSLVTVAGERVAIIPRDTLWRILERVARESDHSGWCYKASLTDIPGSAEAVRDLIDREILAVEGERIRIRVGLFARWLRNNQNW